MRRKIVEVLPDDPLGERPGEPRVVHLQREAPAQLAAMVSQARVGLWLMPDAAPDSAITDTWRLTGTGTFAETVPVLQPGGSMVPTEVQRECEVDIAVRWGTGYDTTTRSFVNIIATPKGGTHQQGFEQGRGVDGDALVGVLLERLAGR